jgi:hypothetical protein
VGKKWVKAHVINSDVQGCAPFSQRGKTSVNRVEDLSNPLNDWKVVKAFRNS